MNNNGVRTIIFDLGRVLIDFDHTIAAKRIAQSTDKTVPDIFDLFFDSGITGLFEEGKISPEDFFTRVKELLNTQMPFQEFLPIWNEIFFFTEQNRQVHALIKSLKGRYRTALLSNVNYLHFEYIRKTFPILDVFDKVFTSYEMGVRKPDPLIYQKVLAALGDSADACFYTDDRPELIESARQLGIRGYVYTGVEALKRSLEAEGVVLI